MGVGKSSDLLVEPRTEIMSSRSSWSFARASAFFASLLPSFAVGSFARGGAKRRPTSEPRPRVLLQRHPEGLPPIIAQTFPDQYESLLAVKVSQLEGLLAEATGTLLPSTEIFESEREKFRMLQQKNI